MSDKNLEEHRKKVEKQKEEEREKIEKEKKDTKKKQEKERKEAKKKHQEGINQEKMKMKKKPFKMSMGLRLFNIILGVVFIVISSFIVLNQELVVNTIILILAGLIVLSGIIRLFNSFYDKDIGGTKRILRFVFALVLIGLGIAIYLLPTLGEDVLLLLLAVGLAIQGLSRIFVGFTHDVLPIWMKIVLLIIGIALIVIAVLAFLSPSEDIENITDLLVYGFILSGIGRIAYGLVGLRETPTKM